MYAKHYVSWLKRKIIFVFTISVLTFTGCGDVIGNNPEDLGSVFQLVNLQGYYDSTEGVNTVDIVQAMCDDGSGNLTPEPYYDHFASATFTNESLPNSTTQTASNIYINRYTIEYIPVTASTTAMPTRNTIPLTDDHVITPCALGTVCTGSSIIVELVPLELKADIYTDYLGVLEQFVYDVHYTFYGQNVFGKSVQVEGYTFIYAQPYDYCD